MLVVGMPLMTAPVIERPAGSPVALKVSGSLSGSLALTVKGPKAVPTVADCGPGAVIVGPDSPGVAAAECPRVEP